MEKEGRGCGMPPTETELDAALSPIKRIEDGKEEAGKSVFDRPVVDAERKAYPLAGDAANGSTGSDRLREVDVLRYVCPGENLGTNALKYSS